MGVPALFRWLSAKYPKIISPVIEEVQGESQKVNLSGINPNGIEFDNLYLDMNGIIHPCCHPEGKEAPKTEQDMMKEIFNYIDRIFAMIRPRKLLYLAIDGVAPRAKMNQQRSRRFRAAQEAKDKQARKEELRVDMLKNGELNTSEHDDDNSTAFDSNCITPGTPFMDLVSRSLKYYIHDKINSEPAWRQINVILSDASVPGEGEHKIVDYIRKQRLEADFDPNQQNVIYGLDADLIMLAMATHESRFHVLREDVFADEKKGSNCYACGKPGHIAENCRNSSKSNSEDQNTTEKSALDVTQQKPFIFLQVHILREYLEAELKPQRQVPFEFNLERAIDDWIFLCFFVGNDFLPHLPSLELREGAIDILLKVYKESQNSMGGYICNGGVVDLKRAQIVMEGLAKIEPEIFEKRQLKEERRLDNINRRKALEKEESVLFQLAKRTASSEESDTNLKKIKVESGPLDICSPQDAGQSGADVIELHKSIRIKNIEAAKVLKANLLAQDNSSASIESSSNTRTDSSASLPQSEASNDPDSPADIVRLWEPGARERYYVTKFNIKPEDVDTFAKKVARSYVEGFCWVLAYYYRGCPSWKWFYPYHYAPFAADLVDIADLIIEFEQGEPFRPFDQLMAVFPAASRVHIPSAFHHLMTNHDSEIIDFYPEDFLIDMNGKRAAWQGVALLPFIEESRLLMALNKVYPELSEAENRRNQRGFDLVYTSSTTKLGKWLTEIKPSPHLNEFYEIPSYATPPGAKVSVLNLNEDPSSIGKSLVSHIDGLSDVFNSSCVKAKLLLHAHSLNDYKFDLLPGVIEPERVLDDNDVYMLRSGASAQKFPNILSYGNGPNRHHSMHRDTRDQMMRSDGGYNSNRNSNRGYNSSNYQRRDHNENYSRRDEYTRGYDRFAEYGNSNVSGPYDLNDNSSTQQSRDYGRSSYRPNHNSRYNRR